MATLGSLIQPNEQSYFFALAGPGPGPSSSLQSPVALIPDVAGNTTLAVTAAAPTGASAVSVTGSVGGPGNVIVGGYGVNYRAGVLDASGVLRIGLNSSADPVIQYDSQVTHQLLLGDKSGLSSASVQTNVPFIVRDYTTDPTVSNGIVMNVVSPTSTNIANAALSGATINIGSSTAFPSTLTVSDVTKHGASNYVEVNGSVGSVPLFISGAQGIGGACYIFPDASSVSSSLNLGASAVAENTVSIGQTADVGFVDIGGNGGQGVRLRGVTAGASVQTGIISSDASVSGQLQIQASSGSANSINITDASAVFDQQIVQQVPGTVTYSPVLAIADATYTSGSSADFSIATYDPGLYMCMIRVNQANIADPTTLANIGSGLVYIQKAPAPNDTTSIVVGGGTFGNGNVSITSIVTGGIGASVMRLTVTTGNVFVNVKMLPLTGILPGFST